MDVPVAATRLEHPALVEGVALPPLVLAAGEGAARAFLRFFVANIRNRHTRRAYARQARDFLAWCEGRGLADVRQVRTEHAAAYVEALARGRLETSSVKQALAALRALFDWLVVHQAVPAGSPFAAVRGPRLVVDEGRTPCLDGTQVVELFEAIPTDTLVGLRDRALVGLMAYTFARVGAALAMDVGDYWQEGKTGLVRLREKGGKRRTLAVHHVLEGHLDEYLAAAGIAGEGGTPLFRTARGRTGELTGNRMGQADAWRMLRRRARAAGLNVALCNHTWRATGITNYLEHGGALETAQFMAGHADPRTTKLYDRRKRMVSRSEVERIRYERKPGGV
jgi:site-specific recombinase XerD